MLSLLMSPFIIFLRLLPPEFAHTIAITALRAIKIVLPHRRRATDPAHAKDPSPRQGEGEGEKGHEGQGRKGDLSQSLWGHRVDHPLMLAAGFDKDAQALEALFAFGFAGVEAGTLTPMAQPGNPKPRLFRLRREKALINQMGFNNAGLSGALGRIRNARPYRAPGQLLGVSLGVRKSAANDPVEAAREYGYGAAKVAPFADYLAINISSPNTRGLRSLQEQKNLARIIDHVRRGGGGHDVPIAIKISPDNPLAMRRAIADFALGEDIDALIIANTTLSRPDGLVSRQRFRVGGLSGPPLRALSLANLRYFHRRLEGRIPLISSGGCQDGKDMFQRLAAGASMVQIYTAFVYHGPMIIRTMLRQLKEELGKKAMTLEQLIAGR